MFPTANRRRAVVLCCASALAAAVAPAAHAQPIHQVAPGESLWQIAAQNGLSPAAIAAANGLPADAAVQAGQVVRIPAGGGQSASTAIGSPGAAASSAGAASSGSAGSSSTGGSSGTGPSVGGIVVQPGDTLSAIAARAGVTVTALAAHNGVAASSMLPAGQRLSLPAPGSGSGAATGASASASSTGGSASSSRTAASGSTASGASTSAGGAGTSTATAGTTTPSNAAASGTTASSGTSVSAADIGTTAAANGVPASLARAIAWQESGFDNGAVSSVGAQGAMQVMPDTLSWINGHLSSRTLSSSSAADNVQAGTLYLQHLLEETGGDPDQAAAAYYQGLSSVRARGMYDDTKRYVENVRALRARFGD